MASSAVTAGGSFGKHRSQVDRWAIRYRLELDIAGGETLATVDALTVTHQPRGSGERDVSAEFHDSAAALLASATIVDDPTNGAAEPSSAVSFQLKAAGAGAQQPSERYVVFCRVTTSNSRTLPSWHPLEVVGTGEVASP